MSVQQLKLYVDNADNGYGPWYVDRKDVVAFRTHAKAGGIQILLRSSDMITVRDCPENMEFLLDCKRTKPQENPEAGRRQSKCGVHGRTSECEPPTDQELPPPPPPPPPILRSHDPSRVVGHVKDGKFVPTVESPQRILIFDNKFGAGLSVAAMERIVAEAGVTVAWLKHRDHPDLIRIVEDMGPNAVIRPGPVKIVDVPSGVKWSIEIEGRREVIVEKHRTWGWEEEVKP